MSTRIYTKVAKTLAAVGALCQTLSPPVLDAETVAAS